VTQTGLPTTAPTRLPQPLVFGHFGLAVAGLVVWIIYLATDSTGVAWAAFVVLLSVALLGFTMFARWLAGGGPQHRSHPDGTPPENHLPVPVVAGHGLLAAATLILVLLAALGIGGS
jgi:hypothetical protein